MWKKNEDFSPDDLSQLMASPEAQALAAILRQMDTESLNHAAAAASQGNPEQARELLEPLMQDPRIRELIQKMGGNHGGI